MWGSVSHCSTATQYVFVEWGKNFTYIHDSTYSNREGIDTPSNAPYLSGGFVSPETMAHTPRCTVLLFEKQWFGGWPGCVLGPECRSPRLETIGKGEEFSDEGENLWDGGQRKSIPTPGIWHLQGVISRTSTTWSSVTHSTPLWGQILWSWEKRCTPGGVPQGAGWFPPHHLTAKAPTQALRASNAFYSLMNRYACKARIVSYLRTIFNWKTDANTSQWKRLRRKRNNGSRK